MITNPANSAKIESYRSDLNSSCFMLDYVSILFWSLRSLIGLDDIGGKRVIPHQPDGFKPPPIGRCLSILILFLLGGAKNGRINLRRMAKKPFAWHPSENGLGCYSFPSQF